MCARWGDVLPPAVRPVCAALFVLEVVVISIVTCNVATTCVGILYEYRLLEEAKGMLGHAGACLVSW